VTALVPCRRHANLPGRQDLRYRRRDRVTGIRVATFDRLFAANVRAPYFLAVLAPKMAARGSGNIINTASMAGQIGLAGAAAPHPAWWRSSVPQARRASQRRRASQCGRMSRSLRARPVSCATCRPHSHLLARSRWPLTCGTVDMRDGFGAAHFLGQRHRVPSGAGISPAHLLSVFVLRARQVEGIQLVSSRVGRVDDDAVIMGINVDDRSFVTCSKMITAIPPPYGRAPRRPGRRSDGGAAAVDGDHRAGDVAGLG
jgi:hypothetical protein